jgi:hypothetical protein
MAFKRPFRAIPIQEGVAHRESRERELALERSKSRRTTVKLAVIGLLIGASLGLAILTMPEGSLKATGSSVQTLAIEAGLVRARAPQPGDYWMSCNAARAAGTTPIYAGEPGYRSWLDADGDGVACEPVPAGGF